MATTETVTEVSPGRAGVDGFVFALVAAASFGLAGVLGKGLLDAGWTPGAAVLVRIAVGAAVLLVPTLISLRGRFSSVKRYARLIIVFGLVPIAGTQFCYFQAVSRLPVGIALLLEYTAPLAIIVWMWLRHGHRPGKVTVIGTVVAAVGLVLVLNVTSGLSIDLIGVGWAMLGMLGAATYFILGGREVKDLPPIALAGGGLVVGTVALGLLGLVRIVPMTFSTASVTLGGAVIPWWADALALGVMTAAVSYASGIAASRRLGSRFASFVALTEVLFAVLFAWLLLGELPQPIQLVGGIVLLGGVVVVKLGEEPADATPDPCE